MNSSFLRGPALAPPRIRLMSSDGSANLYSENGLEIVDNIIYQDLGDMTFTDVRPKSVFREIHNKVSEYLEKSSKLISLGGDHSISHPVIDAFTNKYEGLNILQFDAHTDLYDTFYDNPHSHASSFARLMEKGKVGSLTQVGIRTLSDHHREQANRFGVIVIEMRCLNNDFIKKLKGPLYISLDMDVLDPAFAPGVSHHEPGGLSTRKLLNILQKIETPVVGADIVEYNPARDLNDMTAMVAFKLFKELADLMYP